MKTFNIVTGMSGAGKSLVLRSLEDIGFDVTDNPPLYLVESIVENALDNTKTAIGIDVRSRNFSTEDFLNLIIKLKRNENINCQVIFLDSDDAAIRRRYSETRRKHPLTRNMKLVEALASERLILLPIKDTADLMIDTSALASPELKRIIESKFAAAGERLKIALMSFSYRKGVPQEADLVFDVRFFRNPYWDEVLRKKNGLSEDVREYVKEDRDYDVFFDEVKKIMGILIPRYIEEGKSYLTVAFGCTGGQHRSVTVAEEMGKFLETKQYKIDLFHRELAALNQIKA